MERPGVVWIYSILLAIGIIVNLISAILIFLDYMPLINTAGLTLVYLISAIVYVLITIPTVIFLIKFFTLKKESIIWLYISFGIFIVISLINLSLFAVGISALFGWVVWDYIEHKKVNKKPLFT